MDAVFTLKGGSWQGPFADEERARAAEALERGQVLLLPELRFELGPGERILLTPQVLGRAKNVSLDPAGAVRHATVGDHDLALLQQMMRRFARQSTELIEALFPAWRGRLERARTSFRPAEIEGRRSSRRNDDRLLHVDAFPSTPMRGRRILRLFSNVNASEPRIWNVGEPFADMARRLLPKKHRPTPVKNALMAAFGVTRGRRSAYDELMLALHDAAKFSRRYQRDCPKTRIAFAPGTTWICFTDQVMHAALKGQHALEQTFHLPAAATAGSPLAVLEAMTGRKLV